MFTVIFMLYTRMQSKHKQTNCKHCRHKSYGLQLSKYVSLTKSKNYLKRRYRNCHLTPMFFGTPCINSGKLCLKEFAINTEVTATVFSVISCKWQFKTSLSLFQYSTDIICPCKFRVKFLKLEGQCHNLYLSSSCDLKMTISIFLWFSCCSCDSRVTSCLYLYISAAAVWFRDNKLSISLYFRCWSCDLKMPSCQYLYASAAAVVI